GGAAADDGRRVAAALALVVLTLAAFLPVLRAGFINLDDPKYVTANPYVLRGLSLDGLRWASTSFDAANWHPLTWLSHLCDVSLFGLRPAAHHGTSLALHVLAAVLLLLALEAMTGRLWPSLFAAGLFAVHPLRVESVAWVAERKDVLSGALAAATLLLYLRHARRPGAGRLAAVTGVFALGLMAKPTLVVLPLLLLLLDWWPLGRIRRRAFDGVPAAGVPVLRAVREKWPLLALSTASCVVTYLAQRSGGAVAPFAIFPLPARVLNAVASFAGYLAKTLWPAGLIPFYPHRGAELTLAATALRLALLVGAGAAAWAVRRRPWLLCGWLWYLAALAPVIGLVQVGLQGMADRYTYLPSIGLALAVAWEFFPEGNARPVTRAARGATAAALLAALALLAARQAGFWKDTTTLFTRATQVDPANYLAFCQLGADELARNEPGRALPLLARAYALRPEYLVTRYHLGLALVGAGRGEEALPHFAAFLGASPRDADARIARGKLLAELGRHEESLDDLAVALASRPGDPQAHYLQGYSLGQLGRAAAAADAYRKAAALDPQGAAIRFNLAQELRRLGRTREALGEYAAAVRLDPRDAEAHNALGALLAEQGRLAEGLGHLEEAVRLSPGFAAARDNVARLRALLGKRRP
ncbi:MAG TPA: tetratricopeptide repeat protein, partial [Candidatus Methanoperedens sp.]|nr:tetratricopeptide repeat protein [Candidatus Methanoperedens sp.]